MSSSRYNSSRFNSSCATSNTDLKESFAPFTSIIEKRQQFIKAKTKPTKSNNQLGEFEQQIVCYLNNKLDTLITNEDSIKIAFCEVQAKVKQVPIDNSIVLDVGNNNYKEMAIQILSSLQSTKSSEHTVDYKKLIHDDLPQLLNYSSQIELSSIRKVAESRKLMQEVKGKVKEEFIGKQPN